MLPLSTGSGPTRGEDQHTGGGKLSVAALSLVSRLNRLTQAPAPPAAASVRAPSVCGSNATAHTYTTPLASLMSRAAPPLTPCDVCVCVEASTRRNETKAVVCCGHGVPQQAEPP